MDFLERLAVFFGGGPQAAIAATMALAVVVLFVQLQRSQRAHLQTALLIAPIAEKMEKTIGDGTAVLDRATRLLEALGEKQVRPGRSGRHLTSGPPLPPTEGG